MLGQSDIDVFEAKVGGTEVGYYIICRAKLWMFSHGMEMERTSDRVDLGRLLHEESYTRSAHKELMIDNLLRIDFDESSGIIHEVKMSKAFEKAHMYQLFYYIYYLKQKGMPGLKGVLNYPKSKRTETVELTPDLEREIEEIVEGVKSIKRSDTCPAPVQMGACKKCSYEDLCWG